MIDNHQITEYFSFYELTDSHDHPDLVVQNREWFFTSPYWHRLVYSAEYLLQQIREEIRRSIVVLSGGRCPELNTAIRLQYPKHGAVNSQHLFDDPSGGAFDIWVPGHSALAVAKNILDIGLRFHQLRCYQDRNFVHIGMPTGKKDMQYTVIEGAGK